MSGPKVSVYTLTPEEIAAIMLKLQQEEERAVRHQQLMDSCQQYNQEIQKLQKELPDVDIYHTVGKNWLHDENFVAKIRNIKSKLQILKQEVAGLGSEDNESLEQKLDSIKNQLVLQKTELDKVVNQKEKLKRRLASILDTEIYTLFTQEKTVDIQELKDEQQEKFKTDSIATLMELNDNQNLPPLYKEKITKCIQRMKLANANHQLESFCVIELPETLKICKEFLRQWALLGATYKTLYVRYRALKLHNNDSTIEIVPFGEHAIEHLKRLISLEEEKAKEKATQEYIHTTLNAVMADMGYPILGNKEVLKRNKTHFKSDLYRYSEDTAINITYNDNGQISLELGKLDRKSRIPSREEENYLENKMIQFCGHFKEIEHRLNRYGVELDKRIAMTPPTKDYAQIINIEGYHLKTDPLQNTQEKKKHPISKVNQLNEE